MLLLDDMAQHSQPLVPRDHLGRTRRFDGIQRMASEISSCSSRWVMEFDPNWAEFMGSWRKAEFRNAISELGQGGWRCLPLILAFSAMLNSGGLQKSGDPTSNA